MTLPFITVYAWDTSCAARCAELPVRELATLGDHLSHCAALRGRLDTVLATAGRLQALVAHHVVTATLLVAVLAVFVSLLY